jgi:hypothetical protein
LLACMARCGTYFGCVPRESRLVKKLRFDWHHCDTTANAIRCNAGQGSEKKAAYLCGICNLVQTPATPELSLVAGAVSGSSPWSQARSLLTITR